MQIVAHFVGLFDRARVNRELAPSHTSAYAVRFCMWVTTGNDGRRQEYDLCNYPQITIFAFRRTRIVETHYWAHTVPALPWQRMYI